MSDDIGHRHGLSASGLRPGDEAVPLTVLIAVPEELRDLLWVQTLVSALVNLLSRQVGTVREIRLRCAAVTRRTPLPFEGADPDFGQAMRQLGGWTTGGRIPLEVIDIGSPALADVEVHIGRLLEPVLPGAHRLVAVGTGWRAWIGAPERAPNVQPDNPNPLGPMLAACLAAGEVFKRSRGITRGRYIDALAVSLWSSSAAEDWTAAAEGPAVAGLLLPPMHVVGAGAVGQALAYILRHAGLDEAYLAVLDDDRHDTSNLNRCFLAGKTDIDQPKVDAVKRFEGDGLVVYGFKGDLQAYLTSARANLDSRLAAEADTGTYGVLVSCVDRGNSRQQVQSLWPEIIFGGSTLGLVARADIYRDQGGEACLACHNPSERDGDRIWALREQLRGMAPEALAAFMLDRGFDAEAIAEELARPRCGSDGEKAISDLARPPPEFSAGFISLAAGLLLAANLLRELALAPASPQQKKNLIVLSFLKGEVEQTNLSVDEACEQGCAARRSGRTG